MGKIVLIIKMSISVNGSVLNLNYNISSNFFQIFQFVRYYLEQNNNSKVSDTILKRYFYLNTILISIKEFIIRGIHTELSIKSWKKRVTRVVQTGGEEKQPAACVLARYARKQREVRVRTSMYIASVSACRQRFY